MSLSNDSNHSAEKFQVLEMNMSLEHMEQSLFLENVEAHMSLNNKTDAQILSGLKSWVGKEREAVTHVLYHLREVEERKLYLHEASSLFEFCMKVLKYSRHEAQARIDAMRLLKVIPELDADLDSGKISLTVAAQTMSSFRKEDARRKAAGENPLSEVEQKTVLADLMSTSTREADRKLATHFPDQPQIEKTKPVSETLTRMEFNANNEAMKMYERLQAYYYRQTGGSWEKLFALLASHEIERLDTPLRRAPGLKQSSTRSKESCHRSEQGSTRPEQDRNRPEQDRNRSEQSLNRSEQGSTRAQQSFNRPEQPRARSEQVRTRYVRKHIHQQVWSNWERGCDYQLENGERCGSHRNLQKDHILEFNKGGTNNRENLRLLCGAHNRYRSDQLQKLRREFVERAECVRKECLDELLAETVQSKVAVVFGNSM